MTWHVDYMIASGWYMGSTPSHHRYVIKKMSLKWMWHFYKWSQEFLKGFSQLKRDSRRLQTNWSDILSLRGSFLSSETAVDKMIAAQCPLTCLFWRFQLSSSTFKSEWVKSPKSAQNKWSLNIYSSLKTEQILAADVDHVMWSKAPEGGRE